MPRPGTAKLLLALSALLITHAVRADTSQANVPCTVQTCPGLVSFSGAAAFIEQIRIEEGSAILAFHLGLSLLDEDCCFKDAIGYLAFALRTQPRLAPKFYSAMNNTTRNSAGRYARAILAVSARVNNL